MTTVQLSHHCNKINNCYPLKGAKLLKKRQNLECLWIIYSCFSYCEGVSERIQGTARKSSWLKRVVDQESEYEGRVKGKWSPVKQVHKYELQLGSTRHYKLLEGSEKRKDLVTVLWAGQFRSLACDTVRCEIEEVGPSSRTEPRWACACMNGKDWEGQRNEGKAEKKVWMSER